MADDNTIKTAVFEALAQIVVPKTDMPLVDSQIIETVDVSDGDVTVRITFPGDWKSTERFAVEDSIYESLNGLAETKDITIEASRANAGPKRERAECAHHTDHPKPQRAQFLVGVGRVIAVASGKGGVGKSTVAVNLALALKKLGYQTGLLDVDIYGPSLPTLLGVNQKPKISQGRISPVEAHGLRLMSLGFLTDEDAPAIWRAQIVSRIIQQFLLDVDWEGTQFLVVDLPPGTGDAQLTLAQSVPIDGAIIVTTPSDLALLDATRGLRMFQTLNVDVLGIVENMAYHVWSGAEQLREIIAELREVSGTKKLCERLEKTLDQHEKVFIFGKGGGQREAKRLAVPFLGEIPLDGNLRKSGDTGRPLVAFDESSPITARFIDLARTVVEAVPLDEPPKGGKKKGLFSFSRS